MTGSLAQTEKRQLKMAWFGKKNICIRINFDQMNLFVVIPFDLFCIFINFFNQTV